MENYLHSHKEYRECVDFYTSCFDAEATQLTPRAVNIFVFGAQVTLHDNASSPLTSEARKQFHFGAVVSVTQ
jgi:extradiol dioxygenase family protein